MKEQEYSPEKELNEIEGSNLSDTEFTVMIIRILKSIKKDIDTIKKNLSEKCNIWNKYNLERINSRLHEAEDWISNFEDKVENTKSEQQKEKRI